MMKYRTQQLDSSLEVEVRQTVVADGRHLCVSETTSTAIPQVASPFWTRNKFDSIDGMRAVSHMGQNMLYFGYQLAALCHQHRHTVVPSTMCVYVCGWRCACACLHVRARVYIYWVGRHVFLNAHGLKSVKGTAHTVGEMGHFDPFAPIYKISHQASRQACLICIICIY